MSAIAKSTASTSKSSDLWTRFVALFAKMGKLFKAVKAMKVFWTIGSMSLSIIVYAFVGFGWLFALFFCVLLLIHEIGHVIAVKAKGLKASMPIFIPLLGAVIFAPSDMTRPEEAYVGIGGPLLGGLAATAVVVASFIVYSPFVAALGFLGIYLNLLNMTPIHPLDGGRITQIVGPKFKYVGVAVLLAFTFYAQSPGLMIIWLLCLTETTWPRTVRAGLGTFVYVSMIVMEWFSIGASQPIWVNIIDLVLGGFFLIVLFESKPRELSKAKLRPYPSRRIRWTWGGRYFALLGSLAILYIVSINHVQDIRNHPCSVSPNRSVTQTCPTTKSS